jgi:hypothetical protein
MNAPSSLSPPAAVGQNSEGAASGAAIDNGQQRNGGGTLDSWLLDKLFGKH